MSDSFFDQSREEKKEPLSDAAPEKNNTEPGAVVAEDRRVTALIAYIPFLCIVPLLNMRDDPYVYFHARQGLVLFCLEIISFVFTFPHLSQLFWIAMLIGCIGAAVAGAMFAIQGRTHKLPVIGDVADKLKVLGKP